MISQPTKYTDIYFLHMYRLWQIVKLHIDDQMQSNTNRVTDKTCKLSNF